MSQVLGLRIHYPGASTTELVKLRQFPATLGRALKNDVTLDHETISYVHAMIEAIDGKWVLKDLESTNGTKENGVNITASNITHHSMFKIGDVEITFLVDDAMVPDTEPTREIETQLHLDPQSSHLPSKTGVLILLKQVFYLLTFTGLDFYLNFGLNPQPSNYFSAILISVVFSLVLAFFCSFFSKIQSGRYRYFDFLLRCNVIVISLIPLGTFWDLFFFQLGPNFLRTFLEYLLSFGVLFGVGMALGPLLFPKLTIQQLRVWIASFSVGIFALLFAASFLFEDESQHFDFNAMSAYPILTFVLKSQSSPDLYFQSLDKMNKDIVEFRKDSADKQDEL